MMIELLSDNVLSALYKYICSCILAHGVVVIDGLRHQQLHSRTHQRSPRICISDGSTAAKLSGPDNKTQPMEEQC